MDVSGAVDLSAVEQRTEISISDPAFVEYFNLGAPNYTGVVMGEGTALTISAVWRAVSLISSTIASLDSGVFTEADDGTFDPVPQSWLTDPGKAAGMTRFEFWETILLHLLLHGNAFLLHVYNAAGALAGLWPVHPLAVTVERDPKSMVKVYRISQVSEPEVIKTDADLLHIPALCSDGIRGFSPIQVARNSLGTTVAGERATAKTFGNGALMSMLVTPDEDVEEDDAKIIKAELDSKIGGWENAGTIAVMNRRLKFTPWSMTNEDAQFLMSRMFQIEEVARWFGVPPFELMQTEKQTSWGSGVEAQQRGLARQVLGPWSKRVEQRLNWLLQRRIFRFDFSSLERPTPAEETELLAKQVDAGIITRNEARATLGKSAHPDGNELKGADPEPAAEPEPELAMNGATA